jgi:hypothetical protein
MCERESANLLYKLVPLNVCDFFDEPHEYHLLDLSTGICNVTRFVTSTTNARCLNPTIRSSYRLKRCQETKNSVKSGWITRVFGFIECYDLYRILYDLISNTIIMHCTIGCLGSVVIANVLPFIIHICVNWKNIIFTLDYLYLLVT